MARAPKPRELHEKHGTQPESARARSGATASPLLVGGRTLPPAPEGLSLEERERWDWLIHTLGGANLLDVADLHTVEFAAKCIVRAREAARSIHERGLMVESRLGETIANPAVRVERDSMTAFARYCALLGLSPADRARLANMGVMGRPPEDEIEGLAEIRELRSVGGAEGA